MEKQTTLEDILPYVGTEKAKQEMEARRQMARQDEEEIYSKARRDAEALAATGETNFALLNLILSTHSTKGCMTLMDAIRFVHQHDLVHIRRLTRELTFFRKICEELKVRDMLDAGQQYFYDDYMKNEPDPVLMAQVTLEKVNAMARARSKANKYGIVTGKKAEKEYRERAKLIKE